MGTYRWRRAWRDVLIAPTTRILSTSCSCNNTVFATFTVGLLAHDDPCWHKDRAQTVPYLGTTAGAVQSSQHAVHQPFKAYLRHRSLCQHSLPHQSGHLALPSLSWSPHGLFHGPWWRGSELTVRRSRKGAPQKCSTETGDVPGSPW